MAKVKTTQTLVLGGKAIHPNDYAYGAYQGTAPVNVIAASVGANISLASLIPASTLDGTVLSVGDLVLLKDQTSTQQNGIYAVTTSGAVIDSVSAQRFTERNVAFVNVFSGLVNAGSIWGNSTYDTTFNGTIFSTPLIFYPIVAGGTGTGTVTNVSVATANGLGGTVATPTTTPAITLSTSISGILKGNGTAISAAVAGDFPVLNQNTTGNAATATNIKNGLINQIPFQTAPNTTSFISTANNQVLVTDSSGIPSFSSTLPAVNGNAITNLNASNITSGTLPVAYLPVGSASQTGVLQVDGVTIVADGAGVISTVGSGSGSVTSVSVATANGFSGSVATPTSTPVVTVATTVTGILYGDGASIATATAGDFPTLNQDTTGNAATATGATNVLGGADNQLVYQTAAGTSGFISTANNAVLATNSSGVPSMSNTLPAVNANAVQVTDPYTGLTNSLSTTLSNIYNNAASSVMFRSTNINTVMTDSDGIVQVTADNIVVQLPIGANCPVGKVFTVQLANNINCTVETQSLDTIVGTLSNFSLQNPYYSLAVYWTGSTFAIC